MTSEEALVAYVCSDEFRKRAQKFKEDAAKGIQPPLEEADALLGLPPGLLRLAIKAWIAAQTGQFVVVGADPDQINARPQ